MMSKFSRITQLSAVLVGFIVAFALSSFAQAPPVGVPLELARERANRITSVRYTLQYDLTAGAKSAVGKETLKFLYKPEPFMGPLRPAGPGPLLLDFREGTIRKMVLNGKELPVKMENGHIELPQALLKISRNAADQGLLSARKAAKATDNLGRPVGAVPGSKIPDSPDDNVIEIEFTAPIGPSGKAITSYIDKQDNSEYIYTLFVPMDASMAFPCFDQPDIKGKFQLNISVPPEWAVISNTAARRIDRGNGASVPATATAAVVHFDETLPLSTYHVAFAAGPFKKIQHAGEPTVYFRKSQLARAQQEVPELQQITAKGIKFLSDYFARPFPFPKYDLVLSPGMAYGGMEHAGATFLREESVLFRTATTHSDILGRDILTLHELTHQWFGDLVTMRWFDDLWLKEGFAQFMAYRALSSLRPNDTIWKRFYETIKPGAYGIDQTFGTTPIYQDIGNLNAAKSAYGAIVYAKAPGMLKQLWYVLGDDHFRDGLRSYLKENAYANAEWSDLVHAFEQSSGRSLEKWAAVWIRKRGMPEVDVAWSCSGNKMQSLTLTQHDVLNEGTVWPLAMEIGFHYPDGSKWTMPLELDAASTKIDQPFAERPRPCPAWIFANENDYAYGRFLLDAKSQEYVMAHLGSMSDPFQRALLWDRCGSRCKWPISTRAAISSLPPVCCRMKKMK